MSLYTSQAHALAGGGLNLITSSSKGLGNLHILWLFAFYSNYCKLHLPILLLVSSIFSDFSFSFLTYQLCSEFFHTIFVFCLLQKHVDYWPWQPMQMQGSAADSETFHFVWPLTKAKRRSVAKTKAKGQYCQKTLVTLPLTYFLPHLYWFLLISIYVVVIFVFCLSNVKWIHYN